MSRKRTPTTSHNYQRKLSALWESGEVPDGVSDVDILHDDWCDVYCGGYCNCDPDIRVRPQRRN